mmetsp:Transcript_65801/g.208254  ORF Transcript_65801/g.208254 Transcript_65801/m.208254 type:complete len:382 (-) Transcript_65801:152-1297(-)
MVMRATLNLMAQMQARACRAAAGRSAAVYPRHEGVDSSTGLVGASFASLGMLSGSRALALKTRGVSPARAKTEDAVASVEAGAEEDIEQSVNGDIYDNAEVYDIAFGYRDFKQVRALGPWDSLGSTCMYLPRDACPGPRPLLHPGSWELAAASCSCWRGGLCVVARPLPSLAGGGLPVQPHGGAARRGAHVRPRAWGRAGPPQHRARQEGAPGDGAGAQPAHGGVCPGQGGGGEGIGELHRGGHAGLPGPAAGGRVRHGAHPAGEPQPLAGQPGGGGLLQVCGGGALSQGHDGGGGGPPPGPVGRAGNAGAWGRLGERAGRVHGAGGVGQGRGRLRPRNPGARPHCGPHPLQRRRRDRERHADDRPAAPLQRAGARRSGAR